MRGTVVKNETLIKDKQWDIKPEKDINILALTSHIQECKILFAKQSDFQERKKNNNGGKKSVNNGGNSWITITPTSGLGHPV